eukprot:9484044-Pyramimonas_sp.AAC.2
MLHHSQMLAILCEAFTSGDHAAMCHLDAPRIRLRVWPKSARRQTVRQSDSRTARQTYTQTVGQMGGLPSPAWRDPTAHLGDCYCGQSNGRGGRS